MKFSPQKQFMAETRKLEGISKLIINSQSKGKASDGEDFEQEENMVSDGELMDEEHLQQLLDAPADAMDDGEEAEVPPDTARSLDDLDGKLVGLRIQNKIPNSQSHCNLKGHAVKGGRTNTHKINMLNTQKYSSIANRSFHINKINNQLFGNDQSLSALN
jgi:hypothetical protein